MAGAGQPVLPGLPLRSCRGLRRRRGRRSFLSSCQAQEMAKAMKAPIRTKTEASRDVYDAVEGRAVRDEAVVQRKTRNRCHWLLSAGNCSTRPNSCRIAPVQFILHIAAAHIVKMAPLFSLSLMFTSVAALLAPRAAIRSTRLMAEPPIGDLADRLLSAKEKSGKTFDQIADELGFTNTYTTQLLLGQAQLKPETLPKLKKAVPGISAADLETISKAPFRGWDPEILKEPNVYRTYEAITHYGNAIKLLINEKFGDGIMSAIDFYMTVGGTVGKMGEKRVVITFNGKFLPFIEQVAADNSAASPEIAE